MGRVKIPYYAVKSGRGFWEPRPFMREAGFEAVACGPDGPDAWRIATECNARWREYKPRREAHRLSRLCRSAHLRKRSSAIAGPQNGQRRRHEPGRNGSGRGLILNPSSPTSGRAP